MGARLKFWRQSRVPKKGSRDEAVVISRGFAARDGSAVKSHSIILQLLRRQISFDYYTIPPATQAKISVDRTFTMQSSVLDLFQLIVTASIPC